MRRPLFGVLHKVESLQAYTHSGRLEAIFPTFCIVAIIIHQTMQDLHNY